MIKRRGLTVFLVSAGIFAMGATAQVQVAEADLGTPASPSAPAQPAPQPIQQVAAQPDVLTQSAATYATYQLDVTDAQTKPYTSADDIERSLNNLGTQNPDALVRGWLSYSALIASQSPEFTDMLRKVEAYHGRDVLLDGLRNDMRYARSLSGADRALSRALTAVSADTRRINVAADVVMEQAYSLQATGWAKGKLSGKQSKITALRSGALAGRPVDGAMITALSSPDIDTTLGQLSTGSLWDGVTRQSRTLRAPSLGIGSIPLRRVTFGKEPVADRILTLAAYRAVGASDASQASNMSLAMSEPRTKDCIERSQLNLLQCVEGAYNHFEVPYCIGRHTLKDVAACIGDVAK